jgi:hypothetical protein
VYVSIPTGGELLGLWEKSWPSELISFVLPPSKKERAPKKREVMLEASKKQPD